MNEEVRRGMPVMSDEELAKLMEARQSLGIDDPVVHSELSNESEIVAASNQESDFLSDSGFKIAEGQYVAFVDATIDIDLEELITKLKGIKEEIAQEDMDLDAFSKIMLDKVGAINAILDSDTHVKDAYGYYDFKATLESIENKFSAAKNYYRALKIENDRELAIRDINKQLSELKNDQTLSEANKVARAIALRNGLIAAKAAKKEAVEFRVLQESEYSKVNEGKEIVNLKNDLLTSVNELDKMCRNFNPRPLCADSLGEAIRGTRDEVVMFGLAAVQKQREFDNLCEKYHLVYDENLDKKMDNNLGARTGEGPAEPTKPEPPKPAPEPTPTPSLPNSDPAQPEPTNPGTDSDESEIKDEKDLLQALQALNPTANIALVNGEINADVDVKDIKLPEGFTYTAGLGISNNRFNNTDKLISLAVNEEPKREPNPAGPSIPTTPSAPSTPGEGSKPDRGGEEPKPTAPEMKTPPVDPRGHKVEKVRQAIIAPYISSTLIFGGVGALLGVGLSVGLVIPAGIGVTLGAIAQTLHNKLGREGYLSNIEGYETKPDELRATFKSLINGYKNKRNAMREAEKNQIPEPEALPEMPEEAPLIPAEPTIPEVPNDQPAAPQVPAEPAGLGDMPLDGMTPEQAAAYRAQIGEGLNDEPFDFSEELNPELGGSGR